MRPQFCRNSIRPVNEVCIRATDLLRLILSNDISLKPWLAHMKRRALFFCASAGNYMLGLGEWRGYERLCRNEVVRLSYRP